LCVRSDPARSTRFSFDLLITSDPGRLPSTDTVKMQCERDEFAFMTVSLMARLVSPTNSKSSASSVDVAWFMERPWGRRRTRRTRRTRRDGEGRGGTRRTRRMRTRTRRTRARARTWLMRRTTTRTRMTNTTHEDADDDDEEEHGDEDNKHDKKPGGREAGGQVRTGASHSTSSKSG
jgi:hypothetical protein